MKDVSEFLAEEHRGGDSDGSDAGEATEASPRDQRPGRFLPPGEGGARLDPLGGGRSLSFLFLLLEEHMEFDGVSRVAPELDKGSVFFSPSQLLGWTPSLSP